MEHFLASRTENQQNKHYLCSDLCHHLHELSVQIGWWQSVKTDNIN